MVQVCKFDEQVWIAIKNGIISLRCGHQTVYGGITGYDEKS